MFPIYIYMLKCILQYTRNVSDAWVSLYVARFKGDSQNYNNIEAPVVRKSHNAVGAAS